MKLKAMDKTKKITKHIVYSEDCTPSEMNPFNVPKYGEQFVYTIGKENLLLVVDDVDVYAGQKEHSCEGCALAKYNNRHYCIPCQAQDRLDLDDVIYRLISTDTKGGLHICEFTYGFNNPIEYEPEPGEKFFYKFGENTLLLECYEVIPEEWKDLTCDGCILHTIKESCGKYDDNCRFCIPCMKDFRKDGKKVKYKFAENYEIKEDEH